MSEQPAAAALAAEQDELRAIRAHLDAWRERLGSALGPLEEVPGRAGGQRLGFLLRFAWTDLFERPQHGENWLKNLRLRLRALLRPLLTIATLFLLIALLAFFTGIRNGTQQELAAGLVDPSINGVRVEYFGRGMLPASLVDTVGNLGLERAADGRRVLRFGGGEPVFGYAPLSRPGTLQPGAWGHHPLGMKFLRHGAADDDPEGKVIGFGLSTRVAGPLLADEQPLAGARLASDDSDGIYVARGLLRRLGYPGDALPPGGRLTVLYGREDLPIEVPVVGVSATLERDFVVTEGFHYRWQRDEFNPQRAVGRFGFTGFAAAAEATDFRDYVAGQWETGEDGKFRLGAVEPSSAGFGFDVALRRGQLDEGFVREGLLAFLLDDWSGPAPQLVFPPREYTPYHPGQVKYIFMTVYPRPLLLDRALMDEVKELLKSEHELQMDFSSLNKLLMIGEINQALDWIGRILGFALAGFTLLIIMLTFQEAIARKSKKLGVQKAIGLSNRSVLGLYVLQALYTWACAALLFAAVAALVVAVDVPGRITALFEQFAVERFFQLGAGDLAAILAATLLLSIFSTLLAVWRLALLSPAELLVDRE
ncbi:MAG TPA: ABC transporter permease [Gammaproteobacteria bacterium]